MLQKTQGRTKNPRHKEKRRGIRLAFSQGGVLPRPFRASRSETGQGRFAQPPPTADTPGPKASSSHSSGGRPGALPLSEKLTSSHTMNGSRARTGKSTEYLSCREPRPGSRRDLGEATTASSAAMAELHDRPEAEICHAERKARLVGPDQIPRRGWSMWTSSSLPKVRFVVP